MNHAQRAGNGIHIFKLGCICVLGCFPILTGNCFRNGDATAEHIVQGKIGRPLLLGNDILLVVARLDVLPRFGILTGTTDEGQGQFFQLAMIEGTLLHGCHGLRNDNGTDGRICKRIFGNGPHGRIDGHGSFTARNRNQHAAVLGIQTAVLRFIGLIASADHECRRLLATKEHAVPETADTVTHGKFFKSSVRKRLIPDGGNILQSDDLAKTVAAVEGICGNLGKLACDGDLHQ